MKSFLFTVLLFAGLSGKAQYDSLNIQSRITMAGRKIQDFSHTQKAGFMITGGGLAVTGAGALLTSTGKKEGIGIVAFGGFVTFFGLMLSGSALIHLQDAGLLLSPNGVGYQF